MRDQSEAVAINTLLRDARDALRGLQATATTRRKSPDARIAVALDVASDSTTTLDTIGFALEKAGMKLLSITDPAREVDQFVFAFEAEPLEIVRFQDPAAD